MEDIFLMNTHSGLADFVSAVAGLLALVTLASESTLAVAAVVVVAVAGPGDALGATAAGAGALEDEAAAEAAAVAVGAAFFTVATEASELVMDSDMALAASAAVLEAVLEAVTLCSCLPSVATAASPSGTLMESSEDLVDMTASVTATSGWAISIGAAVVEVTRVLEGSELSRPPIRLARMGGGLPSPSTGAGGGVAARGGEAGLLEDRVSGRSGGMSGGGPGAYGVFSSREDRLTAEAAGGRMGEAASGRVVIGTEEWEWSFLAEPAEPRPRMPGAAVFMEAMLLMDVDLAMGAGEACLFSGILVKLLLVAFLVRVGFTSLRGVFGVLVLLLPVLLFLLALLVLLARGECGATVLPGTGGLVLALRLVPGVAAGLGATLFCLFLALTLGSVQDGDRYSVLVVGILVGDSRSALRMALGRRWSRRPGPGLFLGVWASCALATALRGDRVGVFEAGALLGDDIGEILCFASTTTSGSFRTGEDTLEMGTGMREGADLDGLLGSSMTPCPPSFRFSPGADADLVISGSVCTPRDGDGVLDRGLSAISMKREGV